MRLMEIMTTDVLSATPQETADAAYQRMRTQRVRHLIVMEGKNVAGIVSERDLGGPAGESVRLGRSVGELMTPDAISARPTTTVREAANLMRARTLGCLPIVEGGKVVGIVTLTDLLELLGRGAQIDPKATGRWKVAHGSRWKGVRRAGRPRPTPS